MSRRSFFSRLLCSRRSANDTTRAEKTASERRRILSSLIRFFIVVTLMLSALWLLLALWYQLGMQNPVAWIATVLIVGLLTSVLSLPYLPKILSKMTNKVGDSKKANHWLTLMYAGVWLSGLGWYFSLEAKQQRDWQPEVSQILSYTRDANNPDRVTFKNVRNFDWYLSDQSADADRAVDQAHENNEAALEILANERWETRTIDMSKLSGVDVTNSYWMGPLIAHTLVSFRFENDRPLVFSFEIRKEADESFSALAGFFRRFELSLIAAEERDIIYTRSNARGEQVYLFPISHLQQNEVKALFESYLTSTDELITKPAWYNTLTSNCTNIIFYMARIVSGDRLPWDYRIWVSGWLPNYLFDIGMLDDNTLDDNAKEQGQTWSMETWYERTHVNPKVTDFDNRFDQPSSHEQLINNSHEFSAQIRQGLPSPPLADSLFEAESQAKSAARVLH